MDRMPLAERSNQITITLGETSQPISEDKLYLRVQRPHGLLRWDVTIPPSSFGSDAFDLTYSYTAEFARNLMLTVPDPEEQATNDLSSRSQFAPSSGMGGMGGMGGGVGGIGR